MGKKKDHRLEKVSAWFAEALHEENFSKKPYVTLVISDDLDTLTQEFTSYTEKSWRSLKNKEESFDSAFTVDGVHGPIHFTLIKGDFRESQDSWPQLDQSSRFGMSRFKLGEAVKTLESLALKDLEVQIFTKEDDVVQGILCGLEISSYSFKGRKNAFKNVRVLWNGNPLSESEIRDASLIGWSTNWARHLVNLPPNELMPHTYAELTQSVFDKKDGISVEIWDEEKLKKENCNLHLAVGMASASPPRLVVLRYRPKNAPKNQKPVALVGKGITFDTGGLDLKPAQGMRLMKKDMGGSAAVFGAIHYAVESGLPVKIDAYLALAENAVSSNSFRPSDLVQGRNGKTIEIHNTDAEGRLVMADALDVATTQEGENKPEVVVDVATLTGAIKVALGSQMAGLFSNDIHLGKELFYAFVNKGDDVWPMPLYQKYRSQMNSSFADMTNSVDGFGGAVTAALFLESFVNEIPWAHLDIYAWKDSAEGSILESGGSGQAVQGLIGWLKSRAAART